VINITSDDPCDFLCGDNSVFNLSEIKIKDFHKRAIYAVASILMLTNSTFSHTKFTDTPTGAVHCYDCIYINVEGSKFENLFAERGGALLIETISLVNDDSRLSILIKLGVDKNNIFSLISNSTFTNCSAKYGGGVYITNFNITIQKCKFAKNSAINQGGGIYLKPNTEEKPNIWTLISNRFENNSAGLMGAGYFWLNYRPLKEETNLFSNNQAEFGGADRSSQPIYIEMDYSDNLNESIQLGKNFGYEKFEAVLQ
jgi:predicted outer membrane repeat protein